ncbi:helix-turn-helix transcriptional regulator [Ottowia sp.]|uniref:helix-turn-helix transcriptional regulator n=1 Tax=Ottowia sp. TaxID=1898956 RepID=UPI003C755A36
MGQGENWDRLTRLLYDGIANPDDWYAGLDAVRQAVGGMVFHHLSLGPSGAPTGPGLANAETPADKLREYEEVHIQNDVRMPMLFSAPVGGVVFDHEHLDAHTFSRSAIYADWLPSVGLRHTLGIKLRADNDTIDVLGIMREKTDAPYGSRERQLCEWLMPHLMRASQLRARMAELASQVALGLAALDTTPSALAVVSANSEVRFLNTAAQLALMDSDPLRVRNGRIHAADPHGQEALAHLIAAACRQHGEPRAGSLRPGGNRKNVVQVLPLQPAHPLARKHREQPCALLVWTQPHLSRDTAHIATALGLTEVEARLAWMLAQGCSIKDFAKEQGCTLNTARTHARNLLAKTGCHRQGEVAQLVQGLL